MAKTLDQMIKAMPVKQRRKIKSRANELITLETIRRSAALTQSTLAKKLGVGQDAVSRIEGQSDMLVSTLLRYVESAGGELEFVVRFPGRRTPVSIKSFHHKRKSPARRVAA